MKSKFTLFAFVGILFFVFFDSTTNYVISKKDGAPTAVTGSPGDGSSCTASGCHTGASIVAETGWITSDIPGTGYVPDSSYTITCTATSTGCTKFGFEICAEKTGGTKVGTWTITDATNTKTISAAKYVTHTLAGNAGTNSKTWAAKWKAPNPGVGAITFYAAFNIANNDDHASGDVIHSSTLAISQKPGTPSLGIQSATGSNAFLNVFPNPAGESFYVRYATMLESDISIEIYDVMGKKVASLVDDNVSMGHHETLVNTSSLNGSGIYFVKLNAGKEVKYQKLVVLN